ncbi:MAG TPA: ABC transporter permease subunit [Phycisphaerae bacterium]|nr:ABC transporter permease subunit [Phycisphaerae bacterium]
MFSRFYTIAANTFLETIRQPIFGVVLFAAALLMIFNIGLAGFTLEDDDKLLLDLGLSTLLLSGLFLSVFSATGVLTREIENKTILTLVSKPVSRPVLIAGKYAGLLAALGVAFYLCFLVFLLTMRHKVLQRSTDPWDMPVIVFGFGGLALALGVAAFCNYFYDLEFSSTALALAVPLLTLAVLLTGFWDKTWNRQEYGMGIFSVDLFIAAYLVLLAVMVLAAVALAASTRLSQVLTLLVCVLVTAVGLVSDFALGQYQEESLIARVAYQALPNLGIFWVIDAVNSGIPVPSQYLVLATGYSVVLVIALLMIGVALFQRREVG